MSAALNEESLERAIARRRQEKHIENLQRYVVWGEHVRTRSFEFVRGGRRYKCVSFAGHQLEVYAFDAESGLETFVGYLRELVGEVGAR